MKDEIKIPDEGQIRLKMALEMMQEASTRLKIAQEKWQEEVARLRQTLQIPDEYNTLNLDKGVFTKKEESNVDKA